LLESFSTWAQARYASQKLLSGLGDYPLTLQLRAVEVPAAHLLPSRTRQGINSIREELRKGKLEGAMLRS
tara:strand:- start:798 stop:1007 length:210 start_codon:yes stop_codon:yes gene_type:complete